ncbi:MAG: hypothetical protein EA384_15005 [Spirochaetaceae bacterium]|nr:MAG: hypothetical protein EA384_15005 [Spirochaetaceae bacterium]
MKRLLFVVLVLACAVPVFADDALVLPQGVWRTRIIPVYSFARNVFEDDFGVDRESVEADLSVFSLGFAVEYAFTDWITAAMQWTPGLVAWSDIDTDDDGDVTVNRWFDLFAGSKFQLIGPTPSNPVTRRDMRLALAAGFKIPFASADWESEAESRGDGKDFIGANVARNVLGVGARFYFDYIFSERFFVNLYSEFIRYPVDGDAPTLATYGGVATHNFIRGIGDANPFGYDKLPDDKFGYGYDLTLEIEPYYVHDAAAGLRITPSLPVTFNYSPELTLDGKRLSRIKGYTGFDPGPDPLDPGDYVWEDGRIYPDAGPSMLLSVGPTVEFFFTGLKVPTALEVTYSYPVAGRNTNATNALIIQIKNYLKFW